MKFLPSIFKRKNANKDHEAFLGAITKKLDEVNANTDQMRKELSPATASDTWLEEWGSWFNRARLANESDEELRERIFEVLDERATIPALEKATKKILGDDTIVRIYEPYRDMRIFNSSTFSGKGRFQDKDYYRIGVVDIIVNKPITKELIAFMEIIKAAGSSIKFTYKAIPPAEDIVIDGRNKEPVLSNIVSMKTLRVTDQNGRVFSGLATMKRSGDKVIWSQTKQQQV